MNSLQDEFFDDPKLGQITPQDLNFNRSANNTQNPEDWVYVRSRTGTRDTLLHSDENVYMVLSTDSTDPIPDDLTNEDEILDQMPLKMKRNMTVPSPSGDYVTIKQVTRRKKDDGTVTFTSTGRVKYVPVEYLLDVFTYNELRDANLDDL